VYSVSFSPSKAQHAAGGIREMIIAPRPIESNSAKHDRPERIAQCEQNQVKVQARAGTVGTFAAKFFVMGFDVTPDFNRIQL
jgi:hypothetical protein